MAYGKSAFVFFALLVFCVPAGATTPDDNAIDDDAVVQVLSVTPREPAVKPHMVNVAMVKPSTGPDAAKSPSTATPIPIGDVDRSTHSDGIVSN